ncbi:trypsin-like serine peptidase [Pseudonocardia broussonetiae]|uniref:Serine protease n=1 Tax=Pseudonocardia broussonetiae TaxID=2736640 RepID=A0A6M6JM59_9PSEU|nr:trypsin-like peptidase domain-containing protein [Pseudonocardia broussonetiae]QJY48405.1 trypsin-like serine protease [Pseudonocardia broussonetiae]
MTRTADPTALQRLGAAIADLVRSDAAEDRTPHVVVRPPHPGAVAQPEPPDDPGRRVSNGGAETSLDYLPVLVPGSPGDGPTSDRLVRRLLRIEDGSAGPIRTAESVIGSDDRVRIYDTENHPWRMVVQLEISTARTGEVALGSGFLVGPRLILTAGHCVHDATTGGWATEIAVRPGRAGAAAPFGVHVSRRFATAGEWFGDSDIDFDYGVIQLDEPVGDDTGWFGLEVLTAPELQGREVNVCGYPGDLMGGTHLYHSTDRLSGLDDHRVYYRTDTAGGASGCPAWISRSGPDGPDALTHTVIAVHTNGTGAPSAPALGEANSGTRLTPRIVEDVRFWNENGV